MGNNTSKKPSVIVKTPEKSVASSIDESPTKDDAVKAKMMLDPKTPAIPQTPLTQTIASHLNRITNENMNQKHVIKTPSYLLRKKILYDLGYTYSIKADDPRSPSLSIPRTPLKLEEAVKVLNEHETSSFQYNSTLEDSCRDFNTRLDDITMDEGTQDLIFDESEDDLKTDETSEISTKSAELSDQKTPLCDSNISPITTINSTFAATNDTEISVVDGNEINSIDTKASEENISPLEGMYSTPLNNKSHRNGRIPLGVINRRGMSTESTPQNDQESFNIEKFKKDASLTKFDENRGSSRKSKIPILNKK